MKWAGYVAVSAALQRKTHVILRGRELYQNIYTVLVGPPGSGKTTAIRAMREILLKLPSIHVSPTMTSKEKFINLMSKAVSIEMVEGGIFNHVSYNALCDEFAVFLRPGDAEFGFVLTDLYDCPNVFEYQTITRGTDRIEHVYLNVLGGATTKGLSEIIGSQALGLGFTARLFFVCADGGLHIDPFAEPPKVDPAALVSDLESIHKLRGPFSFSPSAIEEVRNWYAEGMPPIPDDPRFAEYLPRRLTHWIKLSAIRSASRHQGMLIDVEDLAKARADMLEMEKEMPLAFENFGANPAVEAIRQVKRWFIVQYMVGQKAPIPEREVINKLMPHIPPQYLQTTCDSMVSSGILASMGGSRGDRLFVPGPNISKD